MYSMIIDAVFDTKKYLKVLFTVFRNRSLGATEIAKCELVTLQFTMYSYILPNCSFSLDSYGYFIYNTTNNPKNFRILESFHICSLF